MKLTKEQEKIIQKVICPRSLRCKATECTHRIPHEKQTGSMGENLCGAAFNVCPSCESIPLIGLETT